MLTWASAAAAWSGTTSLRWICAFRQSNPSRRSSAKISIRAPLVCRPPYHTSIWRRRLARGGGHSR